MESANYTLITRDNIADIFEYYLTPYHIIRFWRLRWVLHKVFGSRLVDEGNRKTMTPTRKFCYGTRAMLIRTLPKVYWVIMTPFNIDYYEFGFLHTSVTCMNTGNRPYRHEYCFDGLSHMEINEREITRTIIKTQSVAALFEFARATYRYKHKTNQYFTKSIILIRLCRVIMMDNLTEARRIGSEYLRVIRLPREEIPMCVDTADFWAGCNEWAHAQFDRRTSLYEVRDFMILCEVWSVIANIPHSGIVTYYFGDIMLVLRNEI